MHEIILIRHGEAAKSPTDDDPGLTTLGQEQAETLARELQAKYPHGAGVQLFSSPKSRAQQTALPVSNLWQKPVVQLDAVIEIPSPEGVSLAQRGEWIRTFLNASWDSLTPVQQEWRNGMLTVLEGLAADRQATTSLIFCHFMVINAVVAAIRNDLRVSQFLPDYTSQTRLTLTDGQLSIVELGRERQSNNRIR